MFLKELYDEMRIAHSVSTHQRAYKVYTETYDLFKMVFSWWQMHNWKISQ